MRGVAGVFERAWFQDPGGWAWTKGLLPLSGLYAAGSALARRAETRRQAAPGCYVIAIGNLTVGGTGKSTIARWLAREAVRLGGRAAIVLRGYRARPEVRGTTVLPDFDGYPLRERVDAFGDEAIAHRLALPREVAVAVDPDRLRAAHAVRDGYGARLVILDDGWEQTRLSWDELWVALDPARPAGNGALLPAGPLRRPVSTLGQASRVLFLHEEEGEAVPEGTRRWLERHAPRSPVLGFVRALRGVSPPGSYDPPEPLPRGLPIGVVSAVGSPSRLERFLRAAGADVRAHAAFPDHARLDPGALHGAIARAREAGAERIVTTEKDEARWPDGFRPALPVLVLRTEARPLGGTDEALAPMRAALLG